MSSISGIVFRPLDKQAAAADPVALQRVAAWLQQMQPDAPPAHRDARSVHFGSAAPAAGAELPAPGTHDLFVYDDGHVLAYADSLKTLLGIAGLAALELTPDADGVAELLGGRPATSSRTLFRQVKRLRPRHAHASAEHHALTPGEQLDRAVAATLDGAGQAGLLLSGGLKSSALAASAQRLGIELSLYSVGIAGSSEFGHSRQVAAALGRDAIELVLGTDELQMAVDELVLALDEPRCEPAAVALHRLALRLRERSPLLLSGDDDGLFERAGAEAGIDPRPWLRHMAKLPMAQTAPPLVAANSSPSIGHRPLTHAALRELAPSLREPRRWLQQSLGANWPAALATRAPVRLALAPALLLQPLRARLTAALATLRNDALAEVLDLDAIAGLVGAYFVGEARSAAAVWRLAPLLLWWAEVLPAWRRAGADAVPLRRKLVVYTALVGSKEALADPLAALPAGASSDLDLDFVCVTDNPALTSPTWRFLLLPSGHLAPEKLSRRPKAMPHEYFPDADYSLYVDNTVTFKRLPQARDLATERPTLFRAFRHATRVNPEQEAIAVAMLGYDDVTTICNQMAFYAARRPLQSITPLTTATVLLRQHHRPEVKRFGVLWWESILAFSKRDQLSFDFARQEAGAEVEYFDGGTHDNDLIRWQGSLSQHRVKASFDDRRYAWLHRDDAAAVADPRGHFLRHHSGSDEAFQKPAPLLEFLCQTQGSSLGAHVSPRRAVAQTLETLLAPQRRAGARWLLVRVHDTSLEYAFDGAEFDAATRVLSMFMAPAQGTLIDVQGSELQADGNVVFVGKAQFDAVVLLGPAAAQLPALLFKLQRLLSPAAGALVAVLGAPATPAQAVAAEAWLQQQLGAQAQAQLQAARHDNRREPLPNSVLALDWRAAQAVPAVAAVSDVAATAATAATAITAAPSAAPAAREHAAAA